MPYKPTGRPPGRPRNEPVTEISEPSPPPVIKTKASNPLAKENSRLRQSYRAIADMLNPNPVLTTYDSRGRPKPRGNHHGWIGNGRPD